MPTTTEAALVGHSPVAEGDATHGTVAAQHGGEGGARQAHAVMEDDNAADEDAEDDLDFS